MRFGIHLPQYGRAASGEAVARVASHCEAAGFADVWVSDHLAVPEGSPYPPAFLFEPVVALTWAAAATSTIGLGTSVLVLPYRHPLHLAKELASLDLFSRGRLVVGAAAGWLEGEFEALGVPFRERGARTDESIDVLRACWSEDEPVSVDGRFFAMSSMKVRPKPGRSIPVWIGGHSDAALRRAVERGDGWHGTFSQPEAVAPLLARLRAERPEESFTLSMRTTWDGLQDDLDQVRRSVAAFADAGVQHLMASPRGSTIDEWLRSVDALADAFEVSSQP